jgi:glycosyltransferase involved in cell wall biosynthesis
MPLPVVVVSGKNPLEAPGGYAAYGRNLCAALCNLGRTVEIVALGARDASAATAIGRLHLVRNAAAARVPFIADVQMTALPLYSRSFARRIDEIAGDRPVVIWGVGPWALAGAWARTRRTPGTTFVASYFTTFLHEMRGSFSALRVRDYGLGPKLQYAGVVGLIGPVFHRMERFLLQRADVIVTHYKSSEDMLSAELGVPREKFHRMAYYTEVYDRPAPATAPHVERSGEPVVITVCRQDPRKGINFLLRAMARLAAQGVAARCVLVGSGSMLWRNRRLAERLGVADRVTFAGFVGDVRPLVEKADVFAFPAIEEGAGSLSVLEAMSLGVPIVATAIDGLPEDLEHGRSALLVPPGDAVALADGLETLLRDPALARRLGQGAREAYERRFSLALMQHDVQRLLGRLERAREEEA